MRCRSRTTDWKIDVTVVMRDHRSKQNMNHRSPKRHSSSYDKEMDHAFTLIFHNIKRLQDGVLSSSDPNLLSNYNRKQPERKPMVRSQPPLRKRSRSEPFVGVIQQGESSSLLCQIGKSGSFHLLSGASKSPLQRRKVRFANVDCAAEEKVQRLPLAKGLHCPSERYDETSRNKNDGLSTNESNVSKQEETLVPLKDSATSELRRQESFYVGSEV